MRTALLLVTCVAAALAGPARQRSEHRCAAHCKANTKFEYTPGRTYVYDYETDVSTTIEGTTTEASRLHVTAKAYVTAVSSCDFTLQLRNVEMQDSDPNDETSRRRVDESVAFQQDLERFPLSFAYQDGKVEELCPASQEPTWVLNFKRGILSALQNSMAKLEGEEQMYETDVAGKCRTDYTVSSGWRSTSVKKSKNLLGCHDREHLISSLQATPYNTASKVQSLPLLKSTHECYQTIKDKRMDKVTCEEKHLFRPFSSQNSGAVTRAIQSLTFTHEEAARDAAADFTPVRTTLLFDHTHPETEQADRVSVVLDLLSELAQKTLDDVRADVPAVFSRLVSNLNRLDYGSLSRIPTSLTPQTRKFFMDALPLVKTPGAMSLVRDLIQQGQMSSTEVNMWLTSLAFVHEPQLDMISAVAPLLDIPRPRQQAMLGVSALVHHYCVQHNKCEDEYVIKNIINKLEAMLGSECRSQDEDGEKNIILALKSIGNIGRIIKSEKVLKRCFQEDNSMETRLAALEAFRRVPCDSFDMTPIMRTYEDMNVDTEVRIAAYLAVMKCPSPETIDRVRERLDTESVNQVGWFVWTHLTNLKETSDPSKQGVKELLANHFLREKFNNDARKFSRNYEGSFFVEKLNSGATAESNIVFSPRSYLPRSAMLNLTVDLFGEAFNLMEVGGRVEGLESFIESFFGPEGYYPEDTISNILKSVRDRRDTELIGQQGGSFNAASKFSEDPQASMYLKVFGNELHYAQMRGLKDLLSSTNINNPWELLMRLTRGDIDYTKSFQFIDAKYHLPTVSGFPVVLKLRGAATVSLKVGGKFDIADFWANKKIDIDGHIKPSAAMEIESSMYVDAFHSHAGMKMTSTLRTNTFVDGKLQVQHGNVVKAKLNMPKDKVEFFDVSSDLFILHRKNYRKQAGITENAISYKACSTGLTSRPLGVALCAELAYPSSQAQAPSFPFTGPATVKLYVEKTDTFSSYELDWTFSKEGQGSNAVYRANLELNTPGSSIDRRIASNLIFDGRSKTGEVMMRTPQTELALSGHYEYSDRMKSVQISYSKDRQERLSVTVQLGSTRTGQNSRFEPLVLVRTSQGDLVRFNGNVLVSDNNKYSTDLTLSGLTQQPINVKGTMKTSDNTVNLDTSLTTGVFDVSMNGVVRKTDTSAISKLTVNYGTSHRRQQQLDLTTKYSWDTRGLLRRYKTFFDIKMTQFPQYNLEASWDHQNSPGHFENDVKIIFNGELMEIEQLWSHQAILGQRNINTKFRVHVPSYNVDFLVSMEHQNTYQTLNTVIRARTNSNNEMRAHLDLSRQGSPLNYQANLGVALPAGEYKWKTQLQERVPGEFNAEVSLQWREEVWLMIAGTYKDQSNSNQLKHDVNLRVDIPTLSTFRVEGSFFCGPSEASVKAKVQLGSSKYTASLDYTGSDLHKLEGELNIDDRTKYSGVVSYVRRQSGHRINMDLRVGRRITVTAVLEPNGSDKKAELEVFWNRDIDQSAAFRLVGELRRSQPASASAVMSYPGRTVNVRLGETASGAKLTAQWGPRQKITVVADYDVSRSNKHLDLTIVSPFTEDIRVTANRRYDGRRFTHKVSGRWGAQDVTYDGTGTYYSNNVERVLNGEFSITSNSIARLSNIKLTFGHQMTDQKLSTEIDFNIRGDDIKFAINLEDKAPTRGSGTNVEGVVTLRAPVYDIDWKLQMSHDFSDIAWNSNFQAKWAQNKKIAIDWRSNYDFYRKEEINGILKIETPFAGYDVMTGDIKYSRDGSRIYTNLGATWPEDNIHLEISGLSNSDVLQGTAKLLSSFTRPLSISATIGRQQDEVHAEFQYVINDKVYSLKTTGVFRSARDMTVTARINYPQHVIFTKVVHQLESNSLASSWEGSWDDKKITVQLGGSFQSSSSAHQLHANCIVTTPYPEWREFSMTLDQTKRRDTYVTIVEVKKNDKTFTATDNLKYTDWLNWEDKIDINNPFSNNYRVISYSEKQEYSPGHFSHVLDGTINNRPMHMKLSFNNRLSESGPVEVHYESSMPGEEKITMDYRYTIERLQKSSVYRTSLEIEYLPGQKIKLTSAVTKSDRKMDISMQFISPFTHPASLVADYDRNGAICTAKLVMQWSGGKKIEVNASGRMGSVRGEANIFMMTPFTGYEHQSLTGQYDTTSTPRTARLSGEWQQKIFELKMTLDTTPHMTLRCELDTPFQGYERMEMTFESRLKTSEPSATITLAKNSRQIRLDICFKPTADRKQRAAIELNTPFDNFRKIVLSATVDPEGRGPEGKTLDLKYTNDNGQSIDIRSNGLFHGARGAAAVNIATSFAGIERIDIGGDYSFLGEDKNIMFKIEKGNKIISISGNGRFGSERGEGQLHFRDSLFCQNMKNNLNVEYDFARATKSGKLILEKDNDKIEITATGTLTANEGNLNILFKSPYVGFETMSLTGQYDLAGTTKSAEINLKKNQEKIRLHLTMNSISPRKSQINAKLSTPFYDYETMEIRGQYDFTAPRKIASLTLSKGNRQFELDLDALMQNNKGQIIVTGKASGRIDLLHGDNFILISNWDGTGREKTASITWRTDRTDKTVEASLTTGTSSFSARLNTPFTGIHTVAISGAYDINNSKLSARLTLEKESSKTEFIIEGDFSAKKSELSLRTESPISGLERVGMTLRYDFTQSKKVIYVSLGNNADRVEMDLNGLFAGRVAEGNIRFVTPFNDWQNVGISAKYDFNQARKNAHFIYEKNGHRSVFAGEGILNMNDAEMRLQTPFEGYRDVAMFGSFENERSKRSIDFNLDQDGHRHRFYIKFTRQPTALNLEIDTPLEIARHIEASIDHNLYTDSAEKEIHIITNRNGIRSELDLSLKNDRGAGSIGAHLTSPYIDDRTIRWAGEYDFKSSTKSFSLRSTLDGQLRYNIQGTATRIPGRSIDFNIDVTFDGESHYLKGEGRRQPGKASFSFEHTLFGGVRKFDGELTYTKQSAEFVIHTPIERWEEIQGDVEFDFDDKYKPKFTLNLRRAYRNRRIHIEFKGEYEPSNNPLEGSIEGSLEIKTPYEGLEEIELKVDIERRNEEKNYKIIARRNRRRWEFTLKRENEEFSDDLDYKAETTITLSSPVPEIRNLKIKSDFDFSGRKKSWKIDYERNNRKGEMKFSALINRRSKTGEVKLDIETPLDFLQRIGFSVNYDVKSDPRKLDATVKLNNRHARLVLSGRRNRGTVTYTSTRPGFENLQLTYDISETSPGAYGIDVKLDYGDGRVSQITGTVNRPKTLVSSGNIQISSQVIGERTLTWDYDMSDINALRGRVELVRPDGLYKGVMSSTNDGDTRRSSVEVTTPQPGYTTLKYENSFTRTPALVEYSSNVITDTMRRSVSFKLQRRGDQRTIDIEIDSPILDRRLLVINLQANKNQPNQDNSLKGSLYYGRNQKVGDIDITYSYIRGGKKGTFEIEVTTPYRGFSTIEIDGRYDVRNHARDITINYRRENRRGVMKYKRSQLTEETGDWEIELRTPLTYLKEIKLKESYDFRNGISVTSDLDIGSGRKLKVELEWRRSEKKLQIKSSLRNDLEIILSPKRIMGSWNGQKIEIKIDNKSNDRKVDLEVDIETPFPDFEDMSAEIKLGRRIPYDVDIKLRRNDRRVELKGSLNPSRSKTSGQFEFTSPYAGLRKVNVDGDYDISGPTKTLNLNINVGGKRIKIGGRGSYQRRGQGNLHLEATTPFKGYKDLKLDAEISADSINNYNGEVKIEIGKRKITANAVTTKVGGRRRSDITITTPYQGMRRIVYHSVMADGEFTSDIEYGSGKKISLSVEYEFNSLSWMSFNGSVRTDYPGYEILEVKSWLHRDPAYAGGLMHVRWSSEELLYASYKRSGYREFEVDVRASLPWGPGDVRARGALTRDMDQKLYSIKADLVYGERVISTEITIKASALRDMQVTLKLYTPFPEVPDLKLDVAYTNVQGSFIARAGLRTPSISNLEAGVEMTDQGSNMRRIGFKVSGYDKTLAVKAALRTIPRNALVELEIETPFHVLPSLKLSDY